MIDTTDLTDRLRSFGFVKYHNYEDAENCIRGFHYLGYEVSFARVSIIIATIAILCNMLTAVIGVVLLEAEDFRR